MSTKLGFPYMGLAINALIFFIGILLSALSFLLYALYAGGYIPVILFSFVNFLGVFLTGWALLGFAVTKELLPKQRLIAFLFAIVLLSVLLVISVTFTWTVT